MVHDILVMWYVEKLAKFEPLESEDVHKINIGGRDCGIFSFTADTKSGAIMDFDVIIIPTKNGIRMLMFACSDAEKQYWRPIM